MKHVLLVAIAAAPACHKTDADYKADVVAALHASVGDELDALMQAAHALQAAAPTHAWSSGDAAAIGAMRDAWRRTRLAYEHVEGATSPLFPDLEHVMDARYDDYLVLTGAAGDPALFDASGVVGMHGIERILYAPDIRPEVVAFERTLPGYAPAGYPTTDADAQAFKAVLVQKLIDDAGSLRAQWRPAAIDAGVAYQGLVGLMSDQLAKIDRAASGEEESRYANVTLFDLRNNLEGTWNTYELFRDWSSYRSPDTDFDMLVEARFTALAALYASLPGDALPPAPAGWSPVHPTPADLATPYGMLWRSVLENIDPDRESSLVFEMNRIAVVLGFPEFVEGTLDLRRAR
jgi:iron uptake system component EfeO